MMISSAQNFEDVLLARAFQGKRTGFYIDIGAWHPTIDSVTRYFYDLGWHGINVEPAPAYHRLLVEERPRDVNLDVAIGDCEGEGELAVFAGSGGSTLNPDYRRVGEHAGLERSTHRCRMTTLKAICEAHAPAAIDFLKIDVEGWEAQVIRGADWKRFRPRVLVIEATRPNSTLPAWEGWDSMVIEAGYRFVYFDGLNRFYVANEVTPELEVHFQLPPNIHDDFIPRRAWIAEQALIERAGAGIGDALSSDATTEALATRLWRAEHLLTQMRHSTSWRITAPLRRISRLISGQTGGSAR